MRKVKTFHLMDADNIDSIINIWIKKNNFELIDVRIYYSLGKFADATVIYLDKSEGEL